MSTKIDHDPAEVLVNPTRMVHVDRCCCGPVTVALCGTPLNGNLLQPDSTPIDCHVCAELGHLRGRRCPRCGRVMFA